MLHPPLQNHLPQILNIAILVHPRSLLAPYRLRLHLHLIPTHAPRLPARLTGRLQLAGLRRVSLVRGVGAWLRVAVLPAAVGAVAVFAGAAVVAVDQDVEDWSEGGEAGYMSKYNFELWEDLEGGGRTADDADTYFDHCPVCWWYIFPLRDFWCQTVPDFYWRF